MNYSFDYSTQQITKKNVFLFIRISFDDDNVIKCTELELSESNICGNVLFTIVNFLLI